MADPNITAEDSIKAVTKRLKALKEMIPGGSSKDAAGAGAAAGAADQMAGEGDEEDGDEEDRLEDSAKPRKRPASGSGLDEGTKALLDRLEAREARLAVRELCESEGFRPTDKQVKILLACEDEETQADLIESWQEANPNPRRKTASGARSRDVLEGADGKPAYKDSKDWAAGLRG